MPLYEFHCDACQSTVELLVRSSTEQLECPECGSQKLEKLLSVPAAPAMASGSMASLPVASSHAEGGCGRPQCGSGRCMFGE